jgi:hypothetical protein
VPIWQLSQFERGPGQPRLLLQDVLLQAFMLTTASMWPKPEALYLM